LGYVRQGLGITHVLKKLDSLISSIDKNHERSTLKLFQDLEILPGSEYARVAIPLDYLPSRDYSPRWGYSRPKIASLSDWFQEYENDYSEFLAMMFDQETATIAIDYNPKNPTTPAFVGGAICAFDLLAIYTMLSLKQPKIYCEIGSGMTTLFARQAILDSSYNTKIISIDPEPRQYVDDLCDQVIRQPLETIDPEWFDQLERGDILFIDGSHRSFMNSDVTVFFVDILARIKPGVIIHIHDITLPYDYPDS